MHIVNILQRAEAIDELILDTSCQGGEVFDQSGENLTSIEFISNRNNASTSFYAASFQSALVPR